MKFEQALEEVWSAVPQRTANHRKEWLRGKNWSLEKHGDLPKVTRSEPASKPRPADFTSLRKEDTEMKGPKVREEAEVGGQGRLAR